MSKRIFFLSHNKADVEVVQQVAKHIGLEKCWVDEAEIKAGDNILDHIDKGISDSRVFVLFWSSNSYKSNWVHEELSQGRIRAIRDRGYRLITIVLDDTPLPNYLQYRNYLDIKKGIDYIVESLKNIERDLTKPEEILGDSDLKDYFQNREEEFDKLEIFTLSDDFSGILILGLEGMGKTSFIKRSIAKFFPNLNPIWIDLELSNTSVRLLSNIAKPLSLSFDLEELLLDPINFWKNRMLPEIASSQNTFLVLDNFVCDSLETKPKSFENILNTMIDDLIKINKMENPGIILASNRMPELPERIKARLGIISIKSLENKFMIRALRHYLRRFVPNQNFSMEKLERISLSLHGYPLALSLVSSQISQKGIDLVLDEIQGVHNLLIKLAQELMAGINLTEEEKAVLILLATSELPLDFYLAKKLLGEKIELINSLISNQLIETSSPGFKIHGILRNYVLESMAKPEQIIESHSKLAKLFENEWKQAPELSAISAEFGSLASFHAISSGSDVDQATIKFGFYEEAKHASIELYRRGQYKTALKYLEGLIKVEETLEPILEFYYALCLNRVGKSKKALFIINKLIAENPSMSRYYHAKGSILSNMNKNDEAVDAFRMAVTISKERNVVALSSLANKLCDVGQIDDASRYIKKAYSIDPGDSQVISVLARVLQEQDNKIKALEMLNEVISRRKTDTRLRARAGLIAKEIGDYTLAKEHLLKAVEDPNLPHTITALADVYIQLQDFESAMTLLESYPKDAYKEASYWSVKANIHRHTKEFEDAIECILRAIRIEPQNVVHYGTAAQIYFDIAKLAFEQSDIEKTKLNINYAQEQIRKGMQIKPKNEVLITIDQNLSEFINNMPL